jgi:hypothetical protein
LLMLAHQPPKKRCFRSQIFEPTLYQPVKWSIDQKEEILLYLQGAPKAFDFFSSGLFWRTGLALNPTKIWPRSAKPFCGNGPKYRLRRCGQSAKIFPSAFASASKPKGATLKCLDIIASQFIYLSNDCNYIIQSCL